MKDQMSMFDKSGLIFYDKYIVFFSGGKDSIAVFLRLLEMGIPVDKIELWHHDIDGKGSAFMDWEVTEDYCRQFAKAFNVKIYFSWKVGGFKREMLRENSLTAPTSFEDENYNVITVGGKTGKPSTRRKFPQVAVSISERWCSGYVKIDVASAAIRNQPRFKGLKIAVLSGERGEESSARAKYNELEPDRADCRKSGRHVDRLRIIKNWTEEMVWSIIARHKVRLHPCYYMGFSRCSCKFCIFGNADQFASAYSISPVIGDEIIEYEYEFGVTIKRNMSITELMALGAVYSSITEDLKKIATSKDYGLSIFMGEGEKWVLPAGAYGEGCGPS